CGRRPVADRPRSAPPAPRPRLVKQHLIFLRLIGPATDTLGPCVGAPGPRHAGAVHTEKTTPRSPFLQFRVQGSEFRVGSPELRTLNSERATERAVRVRCG